MRRSSLVTVAACAALVFTAALAPAADKRDVKKAFKDASGPDWWAEVGRVWRATDDFGIGLAVKSGNTHITLTPEETAAFEGDRIRRLEDRFDDGEAAKMFKWMEEHGAKLKAPPA